MRCVACSRVLVRAAAQVPTRDGPASYGPKCARIAGLILPKRPKRASLFEGQVGRSGEREVDPRQCDLWAVSA